MEHWTVKPTWREQCLGHVLAEARRGERESEIFLSMSNVMDLMQWETFTCTWRPLCSMSCIYDVHTCMCLPSNASDMENKTSHQKWPLVTRICQCTSHRDTKTISSFGVPFASTQTFGYRRLPSDNKPVHSCPSLHMLFQDHTGLYGGKSSAVDTNAAETGAVATGWLHNTALAIILAKYSCTKLSV